MPGSLPDILPLEPYLRPTVWGGRRLGERFGKDLPPGAPVGESLEVSALPGAESVVRSGPLAGRGLAGLAEEFGEARVGAPVRARCGDVRGMGSHKEPVSKVRIRRDARAPTR